MLEALQRKGGEVPALDRCPDIWGIEWIWEAFWWLSTCRSFGMGAGPIPWTAIDRYTQVHRFSPFETEMLYAGVRAMDTVFLEHARADSEKKRAELKADAKKPSPPVKPPRSGRRR